MAFTDPLGDMLTRIRNAQKAGKAEVQSPASKLRVNVLDVLKREGYINDYAVEASDKGKSTLNIKPKYHNGRPGIIDIKRVSKPGRRVYSGIDQLPRVSNGLGILILSTPKGVMSDNEAREAHVGGEILCQVF